MGWLQAARWLLPLAILLAALGLRIAEPRVISDLQLRVFDEFQRRAPRPYEEAPVRIVDLDDESLQKVGQWPWPRTRVADLVDRLSELGATVVAFDVVFAEPDRTSPRSVLSLWPERPELERLRAELEILPDHDVILSLALRRSRVVTGFGLSAAWGGREPRAVAGFSWGGPDPRDLLPSLPGSVPALASLEDAAAGNGCFSFPADGDGILRRVPLLFHHRAALYPSLAAEALRVALGAPGIAVRSVGASGATGFGERTGITHVRIGDLTIPTDSQGRIWVHYTEPRPERLVPAWRILAGEVPRDRIADHIVFVGTSAAGLADLRPTPLDPSLPGVAVHANVVEQALTQRFLVRPDWAPGAELVAVLVLGTALILLQRRLGALGSALLGAAAVTAVISLSWLAFTHWHWLIDPLFPSLVAVAVYVPGTLLGFLHSEGQRRRIRHAFGHYVAPAFVAELAAHPERLKLGGEKRTVTVLFCDIRGFTTISERLEDPEELTSLINRFLTPMTELIMERGGTIDKYMGDCIMALWNAPLDDPHHARNACEAALEMLSGLEKLNASLRQEAGLAGRPFEPLRIGIGINTGESCVGNMGSDQRFDYSVIGDEVNLASRLEGQSKHYGVTIVVGDNTCKRLTGFATLELDRIRVKGKDEAVQIHTVLGDRIVECSPAFRALRKAHEELLAAYRSRDWETAAACLSRCRQESTGLDALYDLYEERVEACRREPPGPDWDGVYTARSK